MGRFSLHIVAVLAVVLTAPEAGQASPATPRTPRELQTARALRPPELDGVLDDDAWRPATPDEGFTQKLPREGRAPSERTALRVLHDDQALYVAFECEQIQSPVVARFSPRDRAVESDWVGIALAPRGGSTAYELAVNAAGVLSDRLRYDDSGTSSNWDGVWDARVRTSSRGWSAEIRIPLSSVELDRAAPGRIGFQARRYISASQELLEWNLIPRAAGGEVSRYGTISGIDRRTIAPSGWVRPSITAGVERDRAAVVRDGRGPRGTLDLGADAEWRSGGWLAVAATIHPDYTDLRTDPATLNLTNYELQLPEKRLFFTEGMDAFATPIPVFYSRRIGGVPPDATPPCRGCTLTAAPPPAELAGALKVRSELGGGYSADIISALTRPTLGTYSGAEVGGAGSRGRFMAAPYASASALRLRRSIDAGEVGVLATLVLRGAGDLPAAAGAVHTCPGGQDVRGGERCFHDALVLGADASLRTDDGSYTLRAQVIASAISGGPPRTMADGTVIRAGAVAPGGRLDLRKEAGAWIAQLAYDYLGRTLDHDDLGFMERQNLHEISGMLAYRTLAPAGPTLETKTYLVADLQDSLAGLNLDRIVRAGSRWKLTSSWEVLAELQYHPRHYDDREVGDGTALERRGAFGGRWVLTSDPRAAWAGKMQVKTEAVPGGGTSSAELELTARPWERVEVRLRPALLSAAGEPRFSGAFGGGGAPLFARLDARAVGLTTEASLAFSPRLVLELYAQLFLASGRHGQPMIDGRVAPGAGSVVRIEDLRPVGAPPGAGDYARGLLAANALLRWDFSPGSSLGLVYVHTRSMDQGPAPAGSWPGPLGLDASRLLRQPADDRLALKLTCRWAS